MSLLKGITGGSGSEKEMGEIILTFDWDGITVNKETKGFKGKKCRELTAFVEKALGAKDEKITYKPEYNNDRKTERKLLA